MMPKIETVKIERITVPKTFIQIELSFSELKAFVPLNMHVCMENSWKLKPIFKGRRKNYG